MTAVETMQKMAADAIRQSVSDAEKAMRQQADQAEVHKHAFRTAFDYLKEMWPPVNTADYFTVAAKKVNERYDTSDQDPLTNKLLMAVYEYLDGEATHATQ